VSIDEKRSTTRSPSKCRIVIPPTTTSRPLTGTAMNSPSCRAYSVKRAATAFASPSTSCTSRREPGNAANMAS
jgi:hypothetical protein